MEWIPDIWAVFLASNFDFSSDILTSPSLQPKLSLLFLGENKIYVPRTSVGMANGEAEAHLLQEVLRASSQQAHSFEPEHRGTWESDWPTGSSEPRQPCSVRHLGPGPE